MSEIIALPGVDVRFGGEVSRQEGVSKDEYSITLRIHPHSDIRISGSVDFELEVSTSLRDQGGARVHVRDPSVRRYIPPEFLSDEDNDVLVKLPWMVKVRHTISVWFFALRYVLRVERLESWRASVLVESEFRNFPDHPFHTNSSSSSGKNNIKSAGVSLIVGVGKNQGRRPYMEDVDLLYEHLPIHQHTQQAVAIFGVLDGHGGADCAQFVSEEFPSTVAKLLRDSSGFSCAEALYRAFQEVDDDYITHHRDSSHAGSTANLALFDKKTQRLYVANTGDTRAVLARNGSAVNLSYDRKASDPEEIARIVNAGGFVVNNRVMGSLAVSRAFGDIPLKLPNRRVLLVDPEITSVDLSSDAASEIIHNHFVIIATDGIWDVLSSKDAVDFVLQRLIAEGVLQAETPYLWTEKAKQMASGNNSSGKDELKRLLSRVADALVTKAIHELLSADNVTVMLALIQTPTSRTAAVDGGDSSPAFPSSGGLRSRGASSGQLAGTELCLQIEQVFFVFTGVFCASFS